MPTPEATLFLSGVVIAVPLFLYVFGTAVQHKRFQFLAPSTKVFCASCTKDLLHACVSGPLGCYLLYVMLNDENAHVRCELLKPNLLHDMPIPYTALFTSGFSVGFFLSDCILLLLARTHMATELGGWKAYALMWLHHLLAICIWPYAMLASRSAVFAVYFLATELSNIGQNVYVLTTRARVLGPTSDRLASRVGGAWLVSFFALRVAPVPYLGKLYLDGHFLVPSKTPKMGLFHAHPYGCGLHDGEWWVSVISIALPVFLNQYWFYLMLRKAWRTLKGTSRHSKERRERERVAVGKEG